MHAPVGSLAMPIPSRALAELSARRRPVLERCAAIAARHWLAEGRDPAHDTGPVLAFVGRQHGRMNEVLALGTNALTIAFEAEVVARSRQRFADAPDDVVEAVFTRWRTSRIGRLRDYVRFVDSLVSYAALALDSGELPDATADGGTVAA